MVGSGGGLGVLKKEEREGCLQEGKWNHALIWVPGSSCEEESICNHGVVGAMGT